MSTCALVATCDFNANDFKRRHAAGQFDFVMAVDGGYAHLQAAGCAPDLALGDFDSLGYVPEGVEVVQHPAKKDKSDLELAFDYAKECGYQEVYVYGSLGGRLDHTIATLQMSARFAEDGIDVVLVDSDSCVKILVGPATYALPLLDKGTVSVFAATDVARDVVERGMEYPLDAATLTNRTTLGLSNELMGERASVSVGGGTLYVFHPIA